MNKRIFIASASSDERLETARAVADELESRGEITPQLWVSEFPVAKEILKSLLSSAEEVDFAVAILGPDDLLFKSR